MTSPHWPYSNNIVDSMDTPNVRKITTFFPSPWLNLRTFGGLRDFAIRGCEHADGRLLLSIPVYLQCSKPQNPKKPFGRNRPEKCFLAKAFIKMHRSSAKTPICHISPVLKQNKNWYSPASCQKIVEANVSNNIVLILKTHRSAARTPVRHRWQLCTIQGFD